MAPKNRQLVEILKEKFPGYTEKELYAFIVCGEVAADGETIRNPRERVSPDRKIALKQRGWVSRGGEKLDHCLSQWGIDVKGKAVLDAGASAGGFTDCLLQRGARFVHSVDVGSNQIDYRLRMDKRVNVLEKTNIMSVSALDPAPELAAADLSFRSITGAASHILSFTRENLLIALIKPQFEADPYEGFDGIIRDTARLRGILEKTAAGLEDEGVSVMAVMESPIKGQKGNTEFFFRLALSLVRPDNRRILTEFLKLF